eukprot:5573333-Amphidinium_carterae.3
MSIHVDDPLGVGPHGNMQVFQKLQQHLEVRVGETMGTGHAEDEVPHYLLRQLPAPKSICEDATRTHTGLGAKKLARAQVVQWYFDVAYYFTHPRTQTARALSSGEAELYGCCAGAAEINCSTRSNSERMWASQWILHNFILMRQSPNNRLHDKDFEAFDILKYVIYGYRT